MSGNLLGVQSLTVALSLALIVCTGAIIGGIAISTGLDVVDKARTNGDDGVATCLLSSDTDIKSMASKYMAGVILGTSIRIESFLDEPAHAIARVARFAEVQHPNVSTSPAFLGGTMRETLRTSWEELNKHSGVEVLTYTAIPWAPSHNPPEVWVPDKLVYDPTNSFGTNTTSDPTPAGWGGEVSSLAGDMSMGVLAPGMKVPMTVATVDVRTGQLSASNYVTLGEADERGSFKHPRTAGCSIPGRWDQGGHVGQCTLPSSVITTDPLLIRSASRSWKAIYNNVGVLNEPNKPIYQPMAALLNRLLMVTVYTVTHPEQVNRFPRQGNRVGVVSITTQGGGLNKVLQSNVLPEGTHLYAVQHNPVSKVPAELIGYNKGRVADLYPGLLLGSPINMTRIISILNHTVVQNDTARNPPSTIAQHAASVMNMTKGYDSFVEDSEGSYIEWTSEATPYEASQTYWTLGTRVQRGDELVWHVALLIPRQAVMGRIDASTNDIREKNRANKKDTDDQQTRSFIVMGVVVGVSCVTLMVCAVVFTSFIVRPLNSLAEDMANVAMMRLECVNLEQRSGLCEVREMQESFVQMVTNLVEYRNYMPQSVLITGSDPESSESGHAELRAQASRSRGSHSASAFGGSTASAGTTATAATARMKEHQKVLSAEGMRKKVVTLVYYNICGWHRVSMKMDSHEICEVHGRYVEAVMKVTGAYKAVCDSFLGDRIVATFNAFQSCSTHKQAALSAVLRLRKELSTQLVEGNPLTFSAATVSGDARIGTMGCAGMKKMTITSACFPWAAALERYCAMRHYGEVVDHSVARDVMSEFILKTTDALRYAKRNTTNDIKVYQVKEECSVGGDEWMYQMESAANKNPMAAWNAAFLSIISGNWAEAADYSAKVDSSMEEVERLRSYIQDRKYTVVPVEWH